MYIAAVLIFSSVHSGAFAVVVVAVVVVAGAVVSGFFVSGLFVSEAGVVATVVSGAFVTGTGVVSAIEELLPLSAEQPPTSITAAKTANEIAICFFFIIYPSFLINALAYILFGL